MIGQNDRQDQSLTGQVCDQAGHCPLSATTVWFWQCDFAIFGVYIIQLLQQAIQDSSTLIKVWFNETLFVYFNCIVDGNK